MPQAWNRPTEMVVKVWVPPTATGSRTAALTAWPLPSSEKALLPQHQAVPLRSSPQV